MFEEANREDFGGFIAQLVDKSFLNKTLIKEFQWKSQMPATNFDLLRRLQQCMNLGQDIIISGLCLVKRTALRGLKLIDTSFYKLAVVCIFIAHKFYSDFHYETQDFSISSGITIKDLNKLEKVILDLLDYNIILTQRDYYGVSGLGKI